MIMRDVNNGWLVRYTHANVASFFFIFVYALIYNFIITNNLFFYILPLLLPFQLGSLAFNKWWAKSYNQIIKICKLTLFSYIFHPLEFTKTTEGLKGFLKVVNNKKPEKKFKVNKNFLQWFVGFTDAEGTFLIQTKNNSEVHFCFKITLHIDDSAVLFLIKDKLGIGVVFFKGNTCNFTVNSLQLIVEVLLPIFDKYPLITHKQLNYRDWRIAVLLKKNSANPNNKNIFITPDTLKKIVKIKENINRNRTNFDGYKISYLMISKYWLLGFVEGDGSFHFSNNRAIFSITQKDRQVLEAISIFIQNIKRAPILNGLFLAPQPNCIITRQNNNTAYQLTITDTDVLFQYIFPFFKDLPFLSRKGEDFKIWIVGLFLIIHGYTKIHNGKAILLKLANNMNSKRYFSTIIDLLEIEEINALFEIEPPFNIYSKKSHITLAKEYTIIKGSRIGYNLHIYKEGEEIQGSPFNSNREGGKAIGLVSVSSIKNYIDTGKVFKDGYTFYSSPKYKK
jgi:hypothetical protein